MQLLREGPTKSLSGHITVEMMQYVSWVLHRPLVRIAEEIRRLALSGPIQQAGRHEVTTALYIILSHRLAESCIQVDNSSKMNHFLNHCSPPFSLPKTK